MKVKPFVLAGAAGSMVLAGTALGDYVGVSAEAYVGEGWVDNGYDTGALTTYRLYANFEGAGDDGVLSVFGIGGLPMSVQSTSGTFSNSPTGLDALTAPQDLTFLGIWENQWDTYVTIGTDNADGDATSVSPGFDAATNGLASNWSSDNAGWFVTPDDGQSMAVDGRVFLAQFTVENAGDGGNDVSGTINLLLRNNDQIDQIGFSTATPAPGALALLGLAGLAGTRRRRS